MNTEHVIERNGRKYVLYAGLLNEAHSRGLLSIETDLLAWPGTIHRDGQEITGNVAIARASVRLWRDPADPNKGTVTFTGIGDATAENCSRNIVPHLIRMAETRAKARALRDAVNIGMVALEELGEEDDAPEGPNPPVQLRPQGRPTPVQPRVRAPAEGTGRSDLATPAQVRAIYLIGRDQHSLSEAEIDARAHELYGRPPAELSKGEASRLIGALKGVPR